MSADGSVLIDDRPVPHPMHASSLAEVIRCRGADPTLDPRKRRELCSALRSVCRVLRQDPGAVPANPSRLRVLLARVTAAAAGVGPGRWSNIRSLAFTALKRAGIPSMPGRFRERPAPEWERLRAALPDRYFRAGLSRFMSFCTMSKIAPEQATAETFDRFGAALDTGMMRDPGGVHRDTCKLWKKAVTTILGWPQLLIPIPNRRREFAFGIEAFALSFQADVERFLSERANPDVFSDAYSKPVKPVTNKSRRQNILMAATALVKTGFPVQQLTGLDVLVKLENAKAALRFLHERAGANKTGYIHHIAILLKTVAAKYVGKDPMTVSALTGLCRSLKPRSTGLTEKNRTFLRQFADLKKLAALLNLPKRLLFEADQETSHRRGDAVNVAYAIAIGIELVIPIRARNLTGLRFDRHIHRAGDRILLSIPLDETKNEAPIEAEFPPWLVHLIERYLKDFRPRLFESSSPWLLPGENGERRNTGGFGAQIGDFIAKQIGVAMTLHQFRHLAAKLYLDRRPGDYETVRWLLGHKSLVTTMKFYRELDQMVAVQRYTDLITQFMEETTTEARSRIQRGRHVKGPNHD